jgi:hypothetical protein
MPRHSPGLPLARRHPEHTAAHCGARPAVRGAQGRPREPDDAHTGVPALTAARPARGLEALLVDVQGATLPATRRGQRPMGGASASRGHRSGPKIGARHFDASRSGTGDFAPFEVPAIRHLASAAAGGERRRGASPA